MTLREFINRQEKADYFWCFSDVRDVLVRENLLPSLAKIKTTDSSRVTFTASDLTAEELRLEVELHAEPSRCSPIFPTQKMREWASAWHGDMLKAARETHYPRTI